MLSRHVSVARSLRGAAFARAAVASAGPRVMVGISPTLGQLGGIECATRQTSHSQRRFVSLSPRIQRAYPQYSIFGETHMVAFKMIAPTYRLVKGGAIVVDSTKRGRILVEFTTRTPTGGFAWNEQVRVALTPEEVGLICSQLPQYPVEFSRLAVNTNDEEENGFGDTVTNDMPAKVLSLTPGPGAGVTLLLDFVLDGVGNQAPQLGQTWVSSWYMIH
jgi:Whirly transcription factor